MLQQQERRSKCTYMFMFIYSSLLRGEICFHWNRSYGVSKNREFYANFKTAKLPYGQNIIKKSSNLTNRCIILLSTILFVLISINTGGGGESFCHKGEFAVFEIIIKFSSFLIPTMAYLKKKKKLTYLQKRCTLMNIYVHTYGIWLKDFSFIQSFWYYSIEVPFKTSDLIKNNI
jgi:hypothetical protein